MRAGRSIGGGDPGGLPEGPHGDHRREHRHAAGRVHPLHPRHRGRQGLRASRSASASSSRCSRRCSPRRRSSTRCAARGCCAAARALGAGEQRVRFRFDYMGASKWFFSMSGVILLIGALAIARQGHQLRHRLRVGHPDHRAARARGHGRAGAQRARRPRRGGREDPDDRQPRAGPQRRPDLHADAAAAAGRRGQRRSSTESFGLAQEPEIESIGPTFGESVANSALIAIIASLT